MAGKLSVEMYVGCDDHTWQMYTIEVDDLGLDDVDFAKIASAYCAKS